MNQRNVSYFFEHIFMISSFDFRKFYQSESAKRNEQIVEIDTNDFHMNDHADDLDDKQEDEMQDFDVAEEDKENIQANEHICDKDIIIKKVLYSAIIYEFEFYVCHLPKLTIFLFGKIQKMYGAVLLQRFLLIAQRTEENSKDWPIHSSAA